MPTFEIVTVDREARLLEEAEQRALGMRVAYLSGPDAFDAWRDGDFERVQKGLAEFLGEDQQKNGSG